MAANRLHRIKDVNLLVGDHLLDGKVGRTVDAHAGLSIPKQIPKHYQ